MVEVDSADNLAAGFATLRGAGADAFLVLADPLWNVVRPRLLELVAQSGLPTLHTGRAFVDEGGLMSDATRTGVNSRLGGQYVARILKGERQRIFP